jgi:hypothetical protein
MPIAYDRMISRKPCLTVAGDATIRRGSIASPKKFPFAVDITTGPEDPAGLFAPSSKTK